MKSSEWLQSGSTAALRKSQNIRERTFFINFSILAAPGAWQEWQGSNLRPPVLEIGRVNSRSCDLILVSPSFQAVSPHTLPSPCYPVSRCPAWFWSKLGSGVGCAIPPVRAVDNGLQPLAASPALPRFLQMILQNR